MTPQQGRTVRDLIRELKETLKRAQKLLENLGKP